mmetsp:Transcript_55761/g.135111  ORF Transcript_55761/g.135111 Transcript_55761/m.135111 type:complete len:115 (-) Transcript_55761:1023-1367(-)
MTDNVDRSETTRETGSSEDTSDRSDHQSEVISALTLRDGRSLSKSRLQHQLKKAVVDTGTRSFRNDDVETSWQKQQKINHHHPHRNSFIKGVWSRSMDFNQSKERNLTVDTGSC